MSVAQPPARAGRSVVKKYTKLGFGLLAAVLLVATVLSQKDEFLSAVQRLTWVSVVLALTTAFLAAGANLLSWRGAMSGVGVTFALPLSCRVFFISQLGKYVPGSVWPIVAQIELTKDLGIPRSRSTTGALVGMTVGVVTSGVVSTLLLLTTARDSLADYWYVVVIVPCALIALSPPVLERLLRVVGRVTRREVATTRLTWTGLGTAVFWSFVMWGMFGLHAWLIVKDLLHSDAPSYFLMFAAFAFAWLAGFLIIVAPAGIGIREAVFVLALGGALAVPDALALALLSRFMLTIVDAVLGGTAILMTPGILTRLRRQPAETQPLEPTVDGPAPSS